MTFEIRPATDADVESCSETFPFAKPDEWRVDAHSRVAVVDGDVVGWGIRTPNMAHATRDVVILEVAAEHRRQGIGTALLRHLQALRQVPLSAKMTVLDTPRTQDIATNGFLAAMGVHVCQRCPLVSIPTDTADTRDWCAQHALTTQDDPGEDAPELVCCIDISDDEYVAAMTDMYLWLHASWSPVSSAEVIANVAKAWRQESQVKHCYAVRRAGAITAIVDLFSAPLLTETPQPILVGEAVDATLPTARADVAACLAAVLASLSDNDSSAMADVHVTDPNMWPLVASIPGLVSHGEMHIVELT